MSCSSELVTMAAQAHSFAMCVTPSLLPQLPAFRKLLSVPSREPRRHTERHSGARILSRVLETSSSATESADAALPSLRHTRNCSALRLRLRCARRISSHTASELAHSVCRPQKAFRDAMNPSCLVLLGKYSSITIAAPAAPASSANGCQLPPPRRASTICVQHPVCHFFEAPA
jgi:hypothetical protein